MQASSYLREPFSPGRSYRSGHSAPDVMFMTTVKTFCKDLTGELLVR